MSNFIVPKRDSFIKKLFGQCLYDAIITDDQLEGLQESIFRCIKKRKQYGQLEELDEMLEKPFRELTMYRRKELTVAMKMPKETLNEEDVNTDPSLLFGPEFAETHMTHLTSVSKVEQQKRREMLEEIERRWESYFSREDSSDDNYYPYDSDY